MAGTPSNAIAATVFRDGNRRWLATVLPRVSANKPFSYALKSQPAANSSDLRGIHFRPDGQNLLVMLDDKLLTAYRIDFRNKPIFFPLVGPTGESFTRAYPMEKVPGEDNDHPHQQSCWFTFGKVNGVDFWSEGGGPARSGKPTASSSSRGPSWDGSGPGTTGSRPAIGSSARIGGP